MVDGTYEVKVDTPLGAKTGMVTLVSRGTVLDGNVEARGLGKLSATGTVNGDAFEVEGSARVFPLGKVSYRINGRVEGDVLTATCSTNKGSLDIRGTRR